MININLKHILIATGITLLLILLWYCRSIISYVLIAAVISLLARPFMDLLNRVKLGKMNMPKFLNAFIVILSFWSLAILFFSFFGPVVAEEGQELSKISREDVRNCLHEPLQRIEVVFGQLHNSDGENQTFKEYVTESVTSFLTVNHLSEVFGTITGLLGNIFIGIFSISFVLFFFLKDEKLFSKSIMRLIPTSYQSKTRLAMLKIQRLLGRYLLGVLIQITLILTLITTGLLIIGFEFQQALLIGLFIGLMNVIPYIGPLIGGAFGILFGIAIHIESDFYTELLPILGYMVIVFSSVQVIDNILFQPLIFSNSVHAHPLEIFLVIMVAGTFAGIPGMILAVPGYTILRVIASEFLTEFKIVKKMHENI